MTDVRSDLDELLLQTTDRSFRFRIRWRLISHLAQPESNGSDLLENAIVQLSGDAHPLRLLRFDQLFVQSADAKLINRPEDRQKREHAQRAKPRRLPVRRGDGEVQERARLVPHPAVIASRHAEAIVAGSKIRIERLPAIADVLPIAIPAFQLVTKKHLLRRDEAEPGIVDLEIANQRRQAQTGRRIVALAIGADLLDMHRRRKLVERKVTRIDDADAVPRQEPNSSIRGFGNTRAEASRVQMTPNTVRTVENGSLDRPLRIADPRVQLGPGNAH